MNKTTLTTAPAGNGHKGKYILDHNSIKVAGQNGHSGNELTKLRRTLAEIQRIQIEMKRELQLVKRIRVEAERCQQDIEARARSQAQMFLLQTRLVTKREIAELKGTYGEQIQRMLADIRMIRITAQEELDTQRKFTDVTRIRALSFSYQEDTGQLLESKEETVNV